MLHLFVYDAGREADGNSCSLAAASLAFPLGFASLDCVALALMASRRLPEVRIH